LFALTDNLIQYVQQILDGLLGNYVKEDTVADSEIEGASEWRSGDKGEEGNTYRTVYRKAPLFAAFTSAGPPL